MSFVRSGTHTLMQKVIAEIVESVCIVYLITSLSLGFVYFDLILTIAVCVSIPRWKKEKML